MAVMEALIDLGNHPSVDKIVAHVKANYPSISNGTVYKTLESLNEKGLIERVKTDKGFMRYDAVIGKHHHLYSEDSDRIEDYYDEELNKLLASYFENKKITNFDIKDIKVHITGKFKS